MEKGRADVLIYRYLAYFAFFLPLPLLPSHFLRLVYLHTLSLLALCGARSLTLLLLVSLSCIHSAIHHLYPFISPEGYNPKYSPFADVFCHFLMELLAYLAIIHSHPDLQIYTSDKTRYRWFHGLTLAFLSGSLLNVLASLCLNENTEISDFSNRLFSITSIFQAISTGYWIATLIHWNKWYDQTLLSRDFVKSWAMCISIILVNWCLYNLSEATISISMTYCYIEALFMVSSWIAVLSELSYL